MKKSLFGSLGEIIKGNAVMIILALCVVAAGALSFYTVNDINEKLDNQNIVNPNSTPDVSSDSEVTQDVQNNAENVPLKPSASPKASAQPSQADEIVQDTEAESAVEEEPATANFVLPVNGEIFAAFSKDELVYNKTMNDWRTHNGIDIRANKDNAVKASCNGKVSNVYNDGMLGYVVEVECGGFTVRYCGLGSNVQVKNGDSVKQGDTIGMVGEIPLESAEESHLHLEILKGGVYQNPNDYLG